MGRKKKVEQLTPDLEVAKAPPSLRSEATAGTISSTGVSEIVEYKPKTSADRWRCERWQEFAEEFGIMGSPGVSPHQEMAQAHEIMETVARPWAMIRRLFGIGPVLFPMGEDPEDHRILTRREVCEKWGIEMVHLRQELDSARGLLVGSAERGTRNAEVGSGPLSQKANEPEGKAGKISDEVKPVPTLFEADEMLGKHGFTDAFFRVDGRPQAENRVERAWFAQRVKDWDRMLSDPRHGGLARSTLLNELNIRRTEEFIFTKPIGQAWAGYQNRLTELHKTYQEQLIELEKFFPNVAAVSQKGLSRSVVADMIKGYQEYMATGSNHIRDGMYTALEIEVECRRSQQAPVPRYRASLPLAVNEARAGLFNQNWKSQFTARQFKRIDAAWTAAYLDACVPLPGEPAEVLPDLENLTDERGDYGGLAEIAKQANGPEK